MFEPKIRHKASGKFVLASRRNHHARRVRYPSQSRAPHQKQGTREFGSRVPGSNTSARLRDADEASDEVAASALSLPESSHSPLLSALLSEAES